jgi:hypothetical protein
MLFGCVASFTMYGVMDIECDSVVDKEDSRICVLFCVDTIPYIEVCDLQSSLASRTKSSAANAVRLSVVSEWRYPRGRHLRQVAARDIDGSPSPRSRRVFRLVRLRNTTLIKLGGSRPGIYEYHRPRPVIAFMVPFPGRMYHVACCSQKGRPSMRHVRAASWGVTSVAFKKASSMQGNRERAGIKRRRRDPRDELGSDIKPRPTPINTHQYCLDNLESSALQSDRHGNHRQRSLPVASRQVQSNPRLSYRCGSRVQP